MGKYKNLNWNNRLQIEALWNAKHTVKEIAEQIGVHQSTIYRELKRGKTVKRKSSDCQSKQYIVRIWHRAERMKSRKKRAAL